MCNCMSDLNKQLAERNTRLTPAWLQLKGNIVEVMVIATEKIDSRDRQGPVRLIATYCPICGAEIDLQNEQPDSKFEQAA